MNINIFNPQTTQQIVTMNSTVKRIVLCVALVAILALFQATQCEAKSKSDIILLGSSKCGPQLMFKTDKKKGNILIMNPCQKKEESYEPYPVYEQSGGYGGGQEEQGYSQGGYSQGMQGYSQGY